MTGVQTCALPIFRDEECDESSGGHRRDCGTVSGRLIGAIERYDLRHCVLRLHRDLRQRDSGKQNETEKDEGLHNGCD